MDAIMKCITSFYEFCQRYNDSEADFMKLRNQLTTLKAALDGLRAIYDGDEPQDYQLQTDVDNAVSYTARLVHQLEAHLQGLAAIECVRPGTLASTGKVKFAKTRQEIDGIQTQLSTQTQALSLLVNSLALRDIPRQSRESQRSDTQCLLDSARQKQSLPKDTDTVITRRGSQSFFTRCTDTASRLSQTFALDNELVATRVYTRTWRRSSSRNVENQNPGCYQRLRRLTSLRSRKGTSRLTECKVLSLGDETSRRNDCLSQYLTREGHTDQRTAVYGRLLQISRDLLLRLKENDNLVAGKQSFIDQLWYDMAGLRYPDLGGEKFRDIFTRFLYLMRSPGMEALAEQCQGHDKQILSRTEAIIDPKYRPLPLDLAYVETWPLCSYQHTQEHLCDLGGTPARIVDVSTDSVSQMASLESHTTSINLLLFFININSYCVYVSEESPSTPLILRDLEIFKNVVNSEWYLCTKAPVVLVLTSSTRGLSDQPLEVPLSKYFPSCSDVEQIGDRVGFVAKEFRNVCPPDVRVMVHEVGQGSHDAHLVINRALKRALEKTTDDGAITSV